MTTSYRPDNGATLIRLQELHRLALEAQRTLRRKDDAADKWRWEQMQYGLEKLLEAYNGNRSAKNEHDSADVPRVGR